MPLFYQHTINERTELAVWKITEPEEFFTKEVFLKNSVTHPHKRLQHLAGRYLIRHLHADFPLEAIFIGPGKKPGLPGNPYHFSISHCNDFAAVIVSKDQQVGIDVEFMSPKIEKIQHKFTNAHEQSLVKNVDGAHSTLRFLTLLWSAKESLFKWYGKGSVDFRENLHILSVKGTETEGSLDAEFVKSTAFPLTIGYRFFDTLCLAWTEYDPYTSIDPATL